MTEPAPGEKPAGDRANLDGVPDATIHHCDLCGAPMLDRHCRLVCPRCGYQRDCSDP